MVIVVVDVISNQVQILKVVVNISFQTNAYSKDLNLNIIAPLWYSFKVNLATVVGVTRRLPFG